MKYVTSFLAGMMLALAGCAALAPDISPTDDDDPTRARVYAAPYEEVFTAAVKAAETMRWQILEADREGHIIVARTPQAVPERGARRDVYEDSVNVIFVETDAGVRVEVASGVRWRPNAEDVAIFLENIARWLERE